MFHFQIGMKLKKKRTEKTPIILLTIKDSKGNIVRRLEGPIGKGFHRVAWDLRKPAARAITIHDKSVFNPPSTNGSFLVLPGKYSVSISKKSMVK